VGPLNNTDIYKTQMPKQLSWVIIAVCVLPFLLNLLGVDFGTPGKPLDLASTHDMVEHERTDAVFHKLSGAFTHTILEWSAFCTAIFTVLLAFVHFRIRGDVTTPIIGVALFCAGCMDAFHTLAADRLIEAVADNLNLIPFTWAICRLFNAVIMIAGVGIFLFRRSEKQNAGFRFVLVTSLLFGAIAYMIIHVCATSDNLPKTMYKADPILGVITRPYDIVPLVLFIFAGVFVYPRFYRRAPNIFSHALIISAIPEIATQLYMAFGSDTLFDNHFNIAHFLKIVAYLVPLAGLTLDYVQTHQEQKLAMAQLKGEIAERERAERDLQLRNTILSTQQETTLDGILVVDDKRKWISCNQRFLEMWGIPSDVVTAGDSKSALNSVLRMLVDSDGFRERVEYLYEHRDKKSHEELKLVDGRTFERYSAPMSGPGDTYYGRVWYYRDITERKQIDRMKNEFISTVSHELRTPLTSISGSLGLIAGGVAGELPGQAKAMVDIAHRNSERLVRLINDILDIEKIESGKMVFNLNPQELMPLVEHAIETNSAYGEQFGIRFVLEKTAPGVKVNVDSDRLMQVFANLLSNAAKFSAPNDEVFISVSIHENKIRIAVTDHGPGIPEEFQTRIFQKFAQADSSDTRQKGGTGLGLSICKAIIEKLGGEIGFETEAGVGTTFHFDLLQWGAEAETVVHHMDLPHQPRILVCEDDYDVANLLRIMLNQGGFNTDIAHNAADAKQLLAQNSYVAMTLDIALPDQDGISLIRELRQDQTTYRLPVVVVSAKAEGARQELTNGSAIAIVDWLDKPIDKSRLLAAVKQAIQQPSGRPRILHIEDDQDVFQVVSGILQDTADVIYATNLHDAKQKLEHETFDLILLDLGLPDGNGLDLLPSQQQQSPSVPVVIFSAKEVEAEIAHKVAAALVKARTSNQELLETIKSLIQLSKSTVAKE